MSETKHLEEILTLQGRLLGLMKAHGELQKDHIKLMKEYMQLKQHDVRLQLQVRSSPSIN